MVEEDMNDVFRRKGSIDEPEEHIAQASLAVQSLDQTMIISTHNKNKEVSPVIAQSTKDDATPSSDSESDSDGPLQKRPPVIDHLELSSLAKQLDKDLFSGFSSTNTLNLKNLNHEAFISSPRTSRNATPSHTPPTTPRGGTSSVGSSSGNIPTVASKPFTPLVNKYVHNHSDHSGSSSPLGSPKSPHSPTSSPLNSPKHLHTYSSLPALPVSSSHGPIPTAAPYTSKVPKLANISSVSSASCQSSSSSVPASHTQPWLSPNNKTIKTLSVPVLSLPRSSASSSVSPSLPSPHDSPRSVVSSPSTPLANPQHTRQQQQLKTIKSTSTISLSSSSSSCSSPAANTPPTNPTRPTRETRSNSAPTVPNGHPADNNNNNNDEKRHHDVSSNEVDTTRLPFTERLKLFGGGRVYIKK